MMTDERVGIESLHEEKFNDPRARITRRGVGLGVGVFLFAVLAAGLSIYSRKTRLEKTREFFGPEMILALQLGERIQMLDLKKSPSPMVELTATPGLGHLRHALLDERHYDWGTVTSGPVSDVCGDAESVCVRLRLTDPTAQRFEEVLVDLELTNGWVGLADSQSRVRVVDRVQTALRHNLQMIMNVEQKRYGERKN